MNTRIEEFDFEDVVIDSAALPNKLIYPLLVYDA